MTSPNDVAWLKDNRYTTHGGSCDEFRYEQIDDRYERIDHQFVPSKLVSGKISLVKNLFEERSVWGRTARGKISLEKHQFEEGSVWEKTRSGKISLGKDPFESIS